MTALRFQTGGRHKTFQVFLRGVNRRWERVAFVYKESNEGCLWFRQRRERKEWMRADT